MTMGVLPQNICSALSNDGGAEDKVFNPVVGMCYDLTGNWWRNNIDQISGGGGAVCVDVWEGGYQVGRHQRTCAAAWVATEFAVSHICCVSSCVPLSFVASAPPTSPRPCCPVHDGTDAKLRRIRGGLPLPDAERGRRADVWGTGGRQAVQPSTGHVLRPR